MASQSHSTERAAELGQDHDLRVTRPSLVGECIITKEPIARFGEHYLNTLPSKEVIKPGGNTVVEAEEDVSAVEMASGHYIIREAIKKIRDRRHEGYDDRLRVERKIGRRRKSKPMRQRIKKEKQPQEGESEENEQGRSERHSRSSHPAYENIIPSCVPTSHRAPMVMPGRGPPSPSVTGTTFVTSARSLLAQLKEIELHPPMLLSEVDEAMLSPLASPAASPRDSEDVRRAWNGENIHRNYIQIMDYTYTGPEEILIPPAVSPYDMRDQSYSRLSESPSP